MATVHRMNHESLSFGAGEMRPVDVQVYIEIAVKHEQKHHLQIISPKEKSLQLWPFTSYNWLFLWDYTSYKWGFVSTYNW